MPVSKITRYTMFGLLYFAQGAIMGYFTALNGIYLRSFEISMSQIGIVGFIAMIPFVLKIFLGMLSDQINLLGLGYRKPYIILGLLIQAFCLFLLTIIHPAQQFGLFIVVAFILMTGMALYDTSTDGLALDTTPVEDEGTIQSFMVGGRALGVVITGALGFVAQQYSWALAFWGLIFLTLLPLPFTLRQAKENPRPPEKKFQWKAFAAFTRRSVIMLGLLGALYSLVTNGANGIINPFLYEKYGIEVSSAGLLTTIWGIGVIIGSLTGGRFTDRVGHFRATQTAIGISFASILILALFLRPEIAWLIVAIFGLAYGYYETVYFATAMRFTDMRIAASMFAILMAIANLGTGIGMGLSGFLVDSIGYQNTFFTLAVLNLLALPALPSIFGKVSARMQQEAASK